MAKSLTFACFEDWQHSSLPFPFPLLPYLLRKQFNPHKSPSIENQPLRKGSRVVVLVEDNLDVVMSVSHTATVMLQGSVLAECTPAAKAPIVHAQFVYLGHSLWQGALKQAQL